MIATAAGPGPKRAATVAWRDAGLATATGGERHR